MVQCTCLSALAASQENTPGNPWRFCAFFLLFGKGFWCFCPWLWRIALSNWQFDFVPTLPSLKQTYHILWKWMVGIPSFPFAMTYFQGELLNFAEISLNFKLRIIFSYRQLQVCKWWHLPSTDSFSASFFCCFPLPISRVCCLFSAGSFWISASLFFFGLKLFCPFFFRY